MIRFIVTEAIQPMPTLSFIMVRLDRATRMGGGIIPSWHHYSSIGL
ncbi:MAG: hypothetical protein MK188_07815 [Gammaproteobacteria bacterium]|nr:hypothetical protein [Gammaproteobacteria bacterium]